VAFAAVQRKGKGAASVASLSIGAGDGWATPTSGNLLVLTANSDATVSTPSGWTAGPSVVDGNGAYIFYKISAGSESTITVTPGASADTAMTVAEYSGNAASPFDVSNSSTIAGSAGNTTTSVSVTTTAAGDLIVAAALLHSAIGANPTSPTWTNSFTNQISASSGATVPTCDSFVAELIAGAAGAYSTAASWTNNANDRQELVIAFTAATTAAFAPYWQGRRRFVPPRYVRPLPRAATPVPAQLNPPYPPAGVKHPQRVRALLPRSGQAAKPVPPQLLPPYPPAGVKHPGRLRNLLARRGRSAQPVPAQVVITAPAFIPQAVHSRVKAYAARRRPAQFMPPDQPGVIQNVRARLRLPRLARGHGVSPPVPQAPAPLFTRIKLRTVRVFRGNPRPVVPAQVVVPPPAYPTQPTRGKKRPWSIRRRRAPLDGWIVSAPHSCTTARPDTGTTARPNTGTTARPDTGTTDSPC
jgi:hypothetical protein